MLSRAKQMTRYAAVIALVLALAACGGGGSGSSSDAGGDSDSGSSTDSGGSGDSGGSADGGSGDSPELEGDAKEGQVKLEWSDDEDADAYNLYYATEGDIDPDSFQIWINQHNGEEVSGINGSPHTVKGLEGGTEYHFAVTPVVNGQEGDKSNEVTATPKESDRNVSKLNDTGITFCADRSYIKDCPVEDYPNQDGDVGRDAAARAGELDKEGTGARGLDYTKIDADGNELPADADDWTCVRDNNTGLMWARKRPGFGRRGARAAYSWYDPDDPSNGSGVADDGADCGGIKCDTHHYVEAVNEQELCGYSDWRMPEVNEALSLTYRTESGNQSRATIDNDFFPGDPKYKTWTGIPHFKDWGSSWAISLEKGLSYSHSDNDTPSGCVDGAGIRVVREVGDKAESNAAATAPDQPEISSAADNCLHGIKPTTPSSEFEVLDSGKIIRHKATGLEWKRCAAGMEWNGDTCTGSPKRMNWQGALQYAAEQDGWRLPNINELRSIVERCTYSPAINQEVFPGTPGRNFYSSSPSRRWVDTWRGLISAWQVDFGGGEDTDRLRVNYEFMVRLVRTAD